MNKGNDCLKNLKLLGEARQDIYDAMSGYCGIHVCCFEAVDAVLRKLITNICGVLPPQPTPIRSLEYPGGYSIKIYGSGPKYDCAPFTSPWIARMKKAGVALKMTLMGLNHLNRLYR
jgi:hypothetical protein